MTTYYEWVIGYPGNTEIEYSGTSLPDPLPPEWGDASQATIISQTDITSMLQGLKDTAAYNGKIGICVAANQYIETYFTMAEYHELMKWQFSLSAGHAAQPYITAINEWLNSIHIESFMKKVDLQTLVDATGLDAFLSDPNYAFEINTDFTVAGNPPCAFTDIQMLVDTNLQMYYPGWSAPDISGYQPVFRPSSSSNSSNSSVSGV